MTACQKSRCPNNPFSISLDRECFASNSATGTVGYPPALFQIENFWLPIFNNITSKLTNWNNRHRLLENFNLHNTKTDTVILRSSNQLKDSCVALCYGLIALFFLLSISAAVNGEWFAFSIVFSLMVFSCFGSRWTKLLEDKNGIVLSTKDFNGVSWQNFS